MTFSKLSGGRDSTAMTIRYLELGHDIDYIIFCDTGYEFPQMYQYIDEVDRYLKKRFDKSLTRLDASKNFYHWAFERKIDKGEREGRYRGIPRCNGMDYCTRETKIYPTNRFLDEIVGEKPLKYRHKILIGYTHDEVENGRDVTSKYGVTSYPLHQWKWNEFEVNQYLNDIALNNPLYKHFNRTGCFLCPKQSLKSFRSLWKFYPKQWEIMRSWEHKAKEMDCVGKTFRSGRKSIEDLEKRFIEEEKQGCLFDDEDMEYNEVCFLCK